MDLSWLLGHARTTFHSSATPLTLPLKASKGSTTKSIPFTDFCRSVTPPCHLSPLLPGGNLQTLYTAFIKTDVPIWYRRRAFTSTDVSCPGSFTVDFVCERKEQEEQASKDEGETVLSQDHTGTRFPDEVEAGTHGSGYLPPRTVPFTKAEWEEMEAGSQDTTPMLVTLHGLSGGSHELYLREVLAPLTKDAPDQQKWKACVINARGCAGSNITSGVLFNARATWDVRQLVKWLREKHPNRPLFGLGFSLGGNILTNYIGEEGDKCELLSAVVVSNPWDLAASNLALQRTWMGREVYSKTMTSNLRKVFTRHIKQISEGNPRLDVEKVRAAKYLHEFDRELQGPTWGYPTEMAYYRDASSVEPLMAVRIPLFAINAEDDPVAPREVLPYEEVKQNPFTVLCTTTMGGHLSWFESGGARWFVKPVVSYLLRMAEEVDHESLSRKNTMEVVKNSVRRTGAAAFHPMQRKLQIQI